jgi:hypothetical protein
MSVALDSVRAEVANVFDLPRTAHSGNDRGLHIISSYLSLAKNLSDFGIKSIAH